MQQLALFTLPRLEIDENEREDLLSEAGLIGEKSSSGGDGKEMSELEFDSNSSEYRPGEGEKELLEGRGGAEEGHGSEDGSDSFERDSEPNMTTNGLLMGEVPSGNNSE